jgi:hypothetical protein
VHLRIDSELQTDVTPVAWLIGRLHFAGTVGAWIPGGFERYARVLHPAMEGRRFVRWRELSAWSGKPLHRTAWADDLLVRSDGSPWEGAGRERPREELEDPDFGQLVEHLDHATRTPGQLWALVWTGYGGMPPYPALELSPSLTSSVRSYVLFGAAIEPGERAPDPSASVYPPYPPTFWWPADRAWFVSTDIDSTSTYVGGSVDLIERVLSDEGLEANPAELDDPIDGSPHWNSDGPRMSDC